MLQHAASPPAVDAIDEPVWPVNVLLVVLGSFVTGLIVSQGDFETSDPLRNGYVHLAIVGWLALLLSMAAAFLGRVVQRRIQIAILLSMLVHLGVCWGMREYRLPVAPSELIAKTEPTPLPPLAKLPEYRVRVPKARVAAEKREEFEKPLPTDLPDTKLPDIQRQAAPPSKPTRTAKKDESTELASLDPKPVDVTRAEASAPRRADHLPGPERSLQQPARVGPADLVPLAKLPTSEPKSAGRPDAPDDVRRQATELARIERRTAEPPVDRPSLQPELRGPQQAVGPRPELASTAPLTAARRASRSARLNSHSSGTDRPAQCRFNAWSRGRLARSRIGRSAKVGAGGSDQFGPTEFWRSFTAAGRRIARRPELLAPRRDASGAPAGTGEGMVAPGSLALEHRPRHSDRVGPGQRNDFTDRRRRSAGLRLWRGNGSGSAGNGLGSAGDGMGLDNTASIPGRGYTPGGGRGFGAGGVPGSAPGDGFGSGGGLGSGVGPGGGIGPGQGLGGGAGRGFAQPRSRHGGHTFVGRHSRRLAARSQRQRRRAIGPWHRRGADRTDRFEFQRERFRAGAR